MGWGSRVNFSARLMITNRDWGHHESLDSLGIYNRRPYHKPLGRLISPLSLCPENRRHQSYCPLDYRDDMPGFSARKMCLGYVGNAYFDDICLLTTVSRNLQVNRIPTQIVFNTDSETR